MRLPRFVLLTLLALAAVAVQAACGDRGEPAAPSTPATGKIAFVRDGPFGAIYVMNADGSGQTLVRHDGGAGVADPSWSADGSRIAFERGAKIYVMSADGSHHTRLSDDHPVALDDSPAWSPDGARMAFASSQRTFYEEEGRKDSDIYVMNTDGSNITRLTSDPGMDLSPEWSPDGTRIAFVSNREQRWDLYIMNADGSKQTLLVEMVSPDSAPAWSPDGTRIAFVGLVGGIQLINVDGSAQTSLTTMGDFDPTWSPDGTHIAFASHRDSDIGFFGPEGDVNVEVYVMNADGSGQTRLTDNPGIDTNPAWSPGP